MYTSDRLNSTFAALADPTRRAILARLAAGEATVTELMQPFAISQPAISKHLRVLEDAGLVVWKQDRSRKQMNGWSDTARFGKKASSDWMTCWVN
jgi:DNA-binding transcriptional ArsR family regulator